MRTSRFLAIVLVLCALAAAAWSSSAGAQAPDYRARIEAAVETLRQRPGDANAWLELNAAARAALEADDPIALLETTEDSPSLEDAVEVAAGRLPSNDEVDRVILSLLPVAIAAEGAVRNNDQELARTFILSVHAVVTRIEALIPRLSGLERLSALVTIAELGAFSGMEEGLVRRALESVREEMLALVLPSALETNACREPAIPRLAAATRLVGELGGDPEPVVRAYNARACADGPVARPADPALRYRSEGSVDVTQEVDGGGTAYRVTLRGAYALEWEAPPAGGDVRGTGTADLLVRIEDRTDRVDCGGGFEVTLPLEVSGTLSGEEGARRVRLTVRPGQMTQPARCGLPEDAMARFGLPPEVEFGDFEPFGITARGTVARTLGVYRVNWTYSLRFEAERAE
jgi:hypothetical protein